VCVRLLTWAFEQDLPCTEKFLLVALADMADENGKCWPSQASLAKRCGMSRETVNRQIGALLAAGLLTVEQRGSGFGKQANRYTFMCDARSHMDVTHDHTCAMCDARSHSGNTSEIAPCVTHDHTNLSKKERKKVSSPPSSGPPQAETMHRASDDAPSSTSPPVVEKSHVRGTRLPADWQPSAADCEFAYAHGLDPGEVADEFADYWQALTGPKATKLDWPATWRNWCRRQHQRDTGRNRSHGLSIAAAISRIRLAGDD